MNSFLFQQVDTPIYGLHQSIHQLTQTNQSIQFRAWLLLEFLLERFKETPENMLLAKAKNIKSNVCLCHSLHSHCLYGGQIWSENADCNIWWFLCYIIIKFLTLTNLEVMLYILRRNPYAESWLETHCSTCWERLTVPSVDTYRNMQYFSEIMYSKLKIYVLNVI